MVKSDLLFEDILESMSSHVAVLDKTGRIITVNEAWKTFARENQCTDKNAYEGTDYLEVCKTAIRRDNDESAIVALHGILEVLQRRRISFSMEYPCHSAVEKRWFEMHVSQMRSSLQGVVIAHYNITKRKQAEDMLRESEEVMRYIIKHDPNAIAVYDLNLHYIAVSDRYLQDYNVKDTEVIGKHHYEVFPEMPQRWKDVHQRCIAGGVERDDDDHFERPDGSTTYNKWECRPWYRAEGKIGGMITYTEVTTERKLAETSLKNSEIRYRRLFESAKDGILILDAETGMIEDVNPFLINLLGFSHEQFLGKAVWELGFLGNTIANQNNFEQLQREEYIRYDDLPLETAGGRRIDVEFVSNTYLVDHKKVIQCNIRNITKRKRAEEEKAKLEGQLLQSQKMEAIGQLAGGVAHDLNNLLTPILGYSEMLLEELHEDDPRHKDISLILQAAESAKILTRQLLAFSRKQVLDMRPVDLSQILADFKKIIRRTIREDINIRTHLNAASVFVTADVGQIEQIIMNLAVNAQDAMPRGGVLTLATEEMTLDETYLTAHPEAIPGRYVVLEVSDTGTGMDSALMEHIFEPFFTTKEMGKGTGLGLSTVYGIVKQHSGFINVYSEPGKGTSFRIYLPRSGDISEIREEKLKKKKLKEELDGNETVLVVEDNDLVRDLACDILRKRGYMIISAKNGRECLDILADYEDQIDLLLTDVIMPDMNGKELYDSLILSRPGLPVIYMSGYTEDVIAHHGVLEKGVDLIHKPFTRKNLTEKVREVLDR